VSVQLHYPEVFDDSSGNRQEDLGDQAKNFIDFEQGLDWTLGMVGMRSRDKLQKGRLKLGKNSLGQ
jgi:hypothetical protein